MEADIRRVRAVLFFQGQGFVLIGRHKPNEPPYYVFPGGGVEDFDNSPEEALHRELQEELGASLTSVRRIGIVTAGDGTAECFFYAETEHLSHEFVGEEKQLSDRGRYEIVFICELVDLSAKTVLPSDAKTWLEQEIVAKRRS